MPGPGIELIGAEEAAGVMELLQSGYLSRYGPSDDPKFGAKVHHIEEEIAKLAGVRYGLGLHGGGSAAMLHVGGVGGFAGLAHERGALGSAASRLARASRVAV